MPRTPRSVEWSVSLYHLMLAAYPAAFRSVYGDAMAQLFRDSAFDGYRRHGLLGLSAVWLRTLADFTLSLIRQHREQNSSEGQALTMRLLFLQWTEHGGALFSVLLLSWRYTHSIVFGRPMRTCAVVSTIILMVWIGSMFHKIGIFALPLRTDVKILGGVIEIRHIYASDEPASKERWSADAKYKSSITKAMPWDFSFSSGHVIGKGSLNGPIRPNYYWQLRVPLAFLSPLLLCWAFLLRPRGNSLSREGQSS